MPRATNPRAAAVIAARAPITGVRNTAARVTVAAFSALALVVSASPAIAGPDATLEHDVPVQGKNKVNYDFWTPFDRWAAVAVRPTKKADITLYGDEGRTNALARSEQLKKEIDVVVADSNHAGTGRTYYPTVKGKGRFQVEADYNNDDLFSWRPLTHVLGSSDVVLAMDTLVEPGAEVSITASTDGNNDLEILVFQSDALASPTWYQGRASAICDVDSGGAGDSETCVITSAAAAADWLGVVILNRKGSGTVTVSRSA